MKREERKAYRIQRKNGNRGYYSRGKYLLNKIIIMARN